MMTQTARTQNDPQPNEIDRILSTEDALVPSSGFLASVMERVREEATAPPPIPFPWKRALPGMLLIAGVLCVGALQFAQHAVPAAREFAVTVPQISAVVERSLEQGSWVALALASALLSWLLSRRMAGRAGLL